MDMKIEIRPGRLLNIEIDKNPKSHTTIFLIHGLGGNSKQWREQVKFLREKHTLIVPDLLGHGSSDKPIPDKNNPYDFNEMMLDLQAIFDKYADEKNIVMGHSYGGALAATLTSRNAGRISRQVLIAPAPCRPSTQIQMIYRLPVFIMNLLRPYMEQNFRKMAFDKSTSPALIEAEALSGKNNRLYVIKYTRLGMQHIAPLDLSRIETPTLLLAGESDQILPPATVQGFYDKLPHLEYSLIPKAAHMLLLEQPALVNQLLKNFIEVENTTLASS